MNPDSVSVMMTTAHVSGGAPASGPIRHLLSSGIQQFQRCDSVGSNSAQDTRSSLVVLQGTLTARRYVDDILTPIVLPMLSSRLGAIYQQDNARPHTARLSQQCLQRYDVLPWPARSPDLSPIEYVWTRWEGNCSRRDTGELTAQMQRLWQDLPQGVISDLIESMPRRISACIAARGGFTTY
ncbi:DDE_3 domain-containing protein [Trichonephila clavipes]|nr:DDE_3 domain-containing protein [Trichonephila clavipes]